MRPATRSGRSPAFRFCSASGWISEKVRSTRKRRTRCLILIGSYIDYVSQTDPASMTRLMKGLDEFLERDQDRALFDLPPSDPVA